MLEDIQCPKPLKNERKRKEEREKINAQQRKNLNCWVGTRLLIIKNLENKKNFPLREIVNSSQIGQELN